MITFGTESAGVDVTASSVDFDEELRPSFHLHSPWGGADVRLGVHGVHQVMNALAAAASALSCGTAVDAVADGLSTAVLSPWRMDLQRTRYGALVLNDAYNANPTSMEAALRSLAALPADRAIAVLGVMAELGSAAPWEHRRIAELARNLGIELITVDAPLYGVITAHGIDEALRVLGTVRTGDAVLVKGSRVAGLEQLAIKLLD